ncbi:MAG: hypothetical protein ACI9IP_000756 [Arcticibacterium sp.]|jgi:hypothetical protein
MNVNFKSILFLGIVSLFLGACQTNSTEDITPQTVSGRWNLQTVTLEEEVQGFPMENSNENVADQELYIEFNSDGTYTTNSDIELGKFSKGSGSAFTNKYEFENNILALTYDDALFQRPLSIYFITEINEETTMNLRTTKKELTDAFADTIDLDLGSQALAQALLGSLVKFDFTLSFTKQ